MAAIWPPRMEGGELLYPRIFSLLSPTIQASLFSTCCLSCMDLNHARI